MEPKHEKESIETRKIIEKKWNDVNIKVYVYDLIPLPSVI